MAFWNTISISQYGYGELIGKILTESSNDLTSTSVGQDLSWQHESPGQVLAYGSFGTLIQVDFVENHSNFGA
jgi:hypothetical protein